MLFFLAFPVLLVGTLNYIDVLHLTSFGQWIATIFLFIFIFCMFIGPYQVIYKGDFNVYNHLTSKVYNLEKRIIELEKLNK